MEIRQLEHFVALSEEGSFTRAAKRLHIAQSGLSQSIKSLENAVGAALFSRSARGALLTDAGAALLPEARRTIAALRAAKDAVAATRGTVGGKLSVGLAHYSDNDLAPSLLGAFHAAYPEVRLRTTLGAPAHLLHDVSDGRLDLAICGKPLRLPPNVTTIELSRAPLEFMCASTHPLAHRRSVTLAEIAGEPYIELTPGWPTREVTDRAFESAGLRRRIVAEVGDIGLRVQMVAAGQGVAINPRLAFMGRSQVTLIPIEPPLREWRLVVGFNGAQPSSAAARSFLSVVARVWLLPPETPEAAQSGRLVRHR